MAGYEAGKVDGRLERVTRGIYARFVDSKFSK